MNDEKVQSPRRPPPAYSAGGIIDEGNQSVKCKYGVLDSQQQISSSSQDLYQQQEQRRSSPYELAVVDNKLNPVVSSAPLQTFEEAFPAENNNKPRWKDWPFAVFFLLIVCGFIAVAGLVLRAWAQTYSSNGRGIYSDYNTGTMNTNAAILLVFVGVIACSMGIGSIALCRSVPDFFIHFGMTMSVLSGLGSSIMYLSLKFWSAGIVYLISVLLTLFALWGMHFKLPLSVEILKTVVFATQSCPQVLIVSLCGTITATAFAMLFSAVIVSTYIKFDPKSTNKGCEVSGGDCSKATLLGLLVFIFFCGYYISEVIRNVIHCTVSGIIGNWYYMSKSNQRLTKRPARGALKRALTYSLGSICFGSLIIPVIETVRVVLNKIKRLFVRKEHGRIMSRFAFRTVSYLLDSMRWFNRYFNHYAYSFISLFGKPYSSAASQVWSLLADRGVDVVIDDNLINFALGLHTMFASYIASLFCFLYLRFTKPAYNATGAYHPPLVAYSFLIAMQISNIANEAMRAATSTFFVALSKDPEVIRASHPETFKKILAAYPDVLGKLSNQKG